MKFLLGVFMAFIVLTLPMTSVDAQDDDDTIYQDPTGYFSVSLTADWQISAQGDGYTTYQYQQANSFITFTTIPLSETIQTTEQGVEFAISQMGVSVESLLARAGQGSWDLFIFNTADGQTASGAATIKLDAVIVFLYTGDNADAPPLYVYDVLNNITFSDAVAQTLPDSPETFDAYVEALVARDNVTLSIAVSYDGNVIYRTGFGALDGLGSQIADADTVYKWGSSTKIVTAIAVMQLWEQGLVQLDAPISDYLPYFPAKFPITVRHLLTHTSGLPASPNVVGYVSLNDGEQLDSADVAREYVAGLTELIHEPGADNYYVNYNFLLLGEIVHEISGMPYVDYVRQHILTPLRMTRTDFIHTPEMLTNTAMPSDASGEDVLTYLRENVDEAIMNQLIARVDGDMV
ncbi:MAG: beta-lactamase family protein, partial [Anaerolineae bacterium]|nr:beta-lactamase family protein [Anaerolineae bacterium]